MHFVDVPHALDRRQHEAVDDASRRREDAHHAVGRSLVLAAALGETVRAGERRAHAQPRGARRLAADHRLHRRVEHRSLRDRRAVVLDQRGLGADDPRAAHAVAERERDRARDLRVRAEPRERRVRNVPRRHVGLVDAREHELERAPLRADDEVDPARIARHAPLELVRDEQRERRDADADRRERDDERRRERAAPRVGEREAGQRHADLAFASSCGGSA